MWGNQSRAIEALGGGILEENNLLNIKPFILESFYYADEATERLIPYFGDFLLDSGAFTFMQAKKVDFNLDSYLERYADFINRNKIDKFFELDVDVITGYDKVKQMRKRLERLTDKQPIPVWHKSRGIAEFEKMCEEYPYVAVGGIVSREIMKPQYKLFPALIDKAHSHGAKIHGLGFTNLALLPKLKWDSVDSTAWTTGNRFGFIYHFDGKTMRKFEVPKGKRLSDSRRVAYINYTEWVKYSKWAEANL